MPFTLAHPAAVLPLHPWCRRHLVWSALVIGSVIPDLEYFIRLQPRSAISHTFLGSFVFGIPAGIALLLLWRLALRPAVLSLLPPAQQRALRPPEPLGPSRWPWVVVSLLLGAWLHLLVDGFTHGNGWAVERVELLRAPLFGFEWPLYKLLQYGGSVLGLALLLAAYLAWIRLLPVSPAPGPRRVLPRPARLAALVTVALAPLAPAAWLGGNAAAERSGRAAVSVLATQFSIGYTTGLVVALLALALVIRSLRK
ncbi:MAG: DUF4184 family protein [Acidobacteria bacterium]|nr:DUF4184 family protein [Acidobacteriota bacterium]